MTRCRYRFSPFLGLLLSGLVLLSSGCATAGSTQDPQIAPQQNTGETLLEEGRRYAELGQSVRAEQYYLAARQAGANPDEVFTLLVETCVGSGRLGSALRHVNHQLRLQPEDVRLLQLAASLSEALGHRRATENHIAELAAARDLSPQAELFLAEYYARDPGNQEEAIARFKNYLQRVPSNGRVAWAAPTLARLVAEREELHSLKHAEVAP
jgi:tetratricopeptide (TPR) repeat protein